MSLTNGRHASQSFYVRLAVACAGLVLTASFVQLSIARAQVASIFASAHGHNSAAQTQQRQGRQEVREVKSTGSQERRKRAASGDDIESSWSTNGQRVQVSVKNVELSEDVKTVKAIRNNGHLTVSEKRDGVTRELKVTPGASGNLTYAYSVQGRQRDFDGAAQAWLSQILLEFTRNSGYAAERRVNWMVSQQGTDGVLREVSAISSDNIKRIYLQQLAGRGNLDSANLVRVIDQARRELTSDFELTEFLLSLKGQYDMSADVRAAFKKAVERLQSDSDRGKVLSAIAALDR